MTREEAIAILDGFKHNPLFNEQHFEALDMAISALSENKGFEGMTNNEVHKAMFGFELDPRYLVTDDNCIVGGEDCPACPLYNKICNNRNFAEWLDSPYKGVSE